jgi:hypothetical protein
MNDLWGILVLLTIMGWWFIIMAYSRTEDFVVLVMVECVIVFIRSLMRRFMHMLHDGLSPEILIALIARERWKLSAAAAA